MAIKCNVSLLAQLGVNANESNGFADPRFDPCTFSGQRMFHPRKASHQ